jgi:hypothetical protein
MALAAVLLASALLAAPSTPAARLAEARQLAEAFQYDKALRLADATLQQPDLDRATLIGLAELVGIAAATLDRPAKAREAFQLLVLVAPEHQLSRNLPPRVRTPYFEARAQAERLGGLGLTPEPPERVDGVVSSLSVLVRDVPSLPARAVRFTVREDGAPERVETVPLPPSRRAALAVAGRAVRWTAELLGDRGAVLRVLQREELPPPPPPVLATPPPLPPVVEALPPPAPPPTWLRPAGYALGGVGLAGLAAGALFGVLSVDARSRLAAANRNGQVVVGVTQREAARLDAAARTDALVANLGFVAGGALLATGVVLALVGGPPVSPAVSFGVGPGGLALAGTF